MVIVTVGAHHRDDVPAGHGILNGLRIMRRVDHDHLGGITDDPDVVVDFPTAAVEFEVSVGDDPLDTALVRTHSTTTDRSTSPACIWWNASSTPSSPMRSETNFSSGSRPWR